jgi:hypothetical protein
MRNIAMGKPRCSRFREQLVGDDGVAIWRASGRAALIIMEILLVRGDRAVAPAAVLVESISPRAAGWSEHRARAPRDGVEIACEAKDGLPVVEPDRRNAAPHGEDVALLSGAAEPLEEGSIAATDCDVRHVTGGPLRRRARPAWA